MERRYFRVGKKLHKIWLTQTEAGRVKYRIDEGEERQASCVQLDEHILLLETAEGRLPVYIVRHSQEVLAQIQGESFQLREEDAEHEASAVLCRDAREAMLEPIDTRGLGGRPDR